MKKLIILLFIFIITFFYFSKQKIQIIYFYNEDCQLINQTDEMINNLMLDFGDKIQLIRVDPFSEKDNVFVKKYNINSVPIIIINHKQYIYDYKYDLLKNQVCKEFLIKPKIC